MEKTAWNIIKYLAKENYNIEEINAILDCIKSELNQIVVSEDNKVFEIVKNRGL